MTSTHIPEEQVIAFVLKQQEKGGKNHSVSHAAFQSNLAEVDAKSVNKAIEDLRSKRLVTVKRDGIFFAPYAFSTVSLTLAGWLQYASPILQIDPRSDVKAVSAYIQAHSPASIDEAVPDTNLSESRFWFAIEQLESQRRITYDHEEHPATFIWIGN